MAAPPASIDLAPGDPPLTLAEVAQHYRMPERQLRTIIRQKGVEVLRYGRTVRFDRHALMSLQEALRCHAEDQVSGSNDDPTPGRLPSSARSRASAYENALRATTPASRKRKLPPSKASYCEPSGTGRVVALAPSPRR